MTDPAAVSRSAHDIASCLREAADALPDSLASAASADFLGHLADDWPKIAVVLDALSEADLRLVAESFRRTARDLPAFIRTRQEALYLADRLDAAADAVRAYQQTLRPIEALGEGSAT